MCLDCVILKLRMNNKHARCDRCVDRDLNVMKETDLDLAWLANDD